MHLQIHIGRSNEIHNFWNLIGPYAASKKVEKEVSVRLNDDDSPLWVIATDGSYIAGFTALRVKKDKAILNTSYTIPKYRNHGVYQGLLYFILDYVLLETDCAIVETVTKTPALLHILEKNGFCKIYNRGRYSIMQKTMK